MTTCAGWVCEGGATRPCRRLATHGPFCWTHDDGIDGPTIEQVQALVDACPQAAMFHETPLHGLHALRLPTFWEDALAALRRQDSPQ